MKKIIIAGGTGFLGMALKNYFEEKGFVVVTLSRKRDQQTTYWNGRDLGEWTEHLEGATALINLAGKSVDCRYTDKNKAAILSSRIDSTRVLNLAMEKAVNKPKVFINSSTATIYVHSETTINTEETGVIGDDFSMNIAKSWEKEFYSTTIDNVRKIAIRSSIVMGKDGGAFPKLKTITRLGMGGKQGNGNQFISWIHINDFCKAIDILISSQLSGSVNVTAPMPSTNKEFMGILRKELSVPFGISQSKWLVELGSAIIGSESELLMKSRYVYPQRLLDAGFKFDYETVEDCLKELVS
ncbi:TIGR01777 family oxidoreductase [Nonlabens sp. Asnod3-A02]|uniref:TIGR01777 family oxidoreductase n=1 Tax=Nonlabens sp. Asnod3-A02 TaxID=3160579 RepID=UPI0038662979